MGLSYYLSQCVQNSHNKARVCRVMLYIGLLESELTLYLNRLITIVTVWAKGLRPNGQDQYKVVPSPLWSRVRNHWQDPVSLLAATNYTMKPRQNGRHFTDDTFKRIVLNENIRIPIEISLMFVPKDPISKYTSAGTDNGLSPTDICVTWPQWVKQDN